MYGPMDIKFRTVGVVRICGLCSPVWITRTREATLTPLQFCSTQTYVILDKQLVI